MNSSGTPRPIARSLPHSTYSIWVSTGEAANPPPSPRPAVSCASSSDPSRPADLGRAEAGLLLGKPLDPGGPGAACQELCILCISLNNSAPQGQRKGKEEEGGGGVNVACPRAGQQTDPQSPYSARALEEGPRRVSGGKPVVTVGRCGCQSSTEKGVALEGKC